MWFTTRFISDNSKNVIENLIKINYSANLKKVVSPSHSDIQLM